MNRDQPMLLPIDRQDWLGDDHPVRTLIVLIERVLDTSVITAGWAKLGGRGRAAYDPVMLAILLAWAAVDSGERSCEKIADRCRRDVTYQYICGEHVPDEDTIRRFREHLSAEIDDLQAQVLQIAALLGLGDFSLAAVDGTKLRAAAAKKANRTEPSLLRLADELDVKAADDSGSGQVELAGAPATPASGKRARVAAALERTQAARVAADAAQAEKVTAYYARKAAGGPMTGKIPKSIRLAEEQSRLDELIAAQQAKLTDWQTRREARIAAGHGGLTGPKPKVHDHYRVVKQRDRVERLRAAAAAEAGKNNGTSKKGKQKNKPRPVGNVTDPDSALMPIIGGFVQGYNCQAAATRDALLVAGSTGNQPGDVGQAIPMLAEIETAVELFITTRRAAGFDCTCRYQQSAPDRDHDPAGHAAWRAGIDTCAVHHGLHIDWVLLDAGYLSEDNLQAPGPPRLIAIGTTRDQLAATAQAAATSPPAADATAHERNAHHLRTDTGDAAYRCRGYIAERPFAQIKHNKGMRTLHTRGLTGATHEWTFIRTIHNLGIILDTIRNRSINLDHLAAQAAKTRQTTPEAT